MVEKLEDEIRNAINEVFLGICDGTYYGLNENSEIPTGTNPVELSKEIADKVMEIVKRNGLG